MILNKGKSDEWNTKIKSKSGGNQTKKNFLNIAPV
jgi:hypothetical protein